VQVRLEAARGLFTDRAGQPGVQAMPLFSDAHEQVRLEQWAAGRKVALAAPGGIELLVLEGEFFEGGETFSAQSWLRLPVESLLEAVAGPQGCRVWVKSGHLAHLRTVPVAASPV
jgi:hypothetical protein